MTFMKVLTGALALAAVAAVAAPADAARKAGGRSSAVSAAIANALHTARYERGFVCYSDHYHYGSSGLKATRVQAERAAISAWSSFVDFEYGSAWANFGRAGSKKMSCSQGSGGWDCSVEARPCKGV